MGEGEGEKIVARFRDGRLLKGFVRNFSIESETIILSDQKTNKESRIPIEELKALFFVKNFEGSSEYVERKVFGIRNLGRKVFIKFIDKESLVGFIEGVIPWDKGFLLAKLVRRPKVFFSPPLMETAIMKGSMSWAVR